ncbi:MAG: hypothetical protein ACR2GR_02345 [Rhodothermales bacterium]
MLNYRLSLAALLIGGLFFCSLQEASAQSHSQTARAFVPSPEVLGMGDAAVAFASRQGVFFYDPAHLAQVARPRDHINLLGVRGLLSSNFFEQERFIRGTIQPAVEEGTVDSLSSEELERALELGRTRTFAGGDLLLPSFMVRVNDFGVGGGVFTRSLVRYHATDGGAQMPFIDFTGQADVIGMVSLAADFGRFGVQGLSAGLSTKYTKRYLTLKEKILDGFRDEEGVYLLTGTSFGVDVGVLYEVPSLPLPGKLNVGVAVYDFAASNFDYSFSRNLREDVAAAEDAARIEAEIEEEVALANQKYPLSSSYRVGVAYTVPKLYGLLKDSGVALDYLDYTKPLNGRQAFLTHFRIGAQTTVGSVLALRAGLSQGYTTFGAGLLLPVVRLDYAFYGVEEGRIPGQLPSWNHSLQLTLSLF